MWLNPQCLISSPEHPQHVIMLYCSFASPGVIVSSWWVYLNTQSSQRKPRTGIRCPISLFHDKLRNFLSVNGWTFPARGITVIFIAQAKFPCLINSLLISTHKKTVLNCKPALTRNISWRVSGADTGTRQAQSVHWKRSFNCRPASTRVVSPQREGRLCVTTILTPDTCPWFFHEGGGCAS